MKYTDGYISSKLSEIGKTGLTAAPIEGVWMALPYQDININQQQCALIIKDVVFIVVVDRKSGEVKIVDDEMNISLVNSTLEQFCQCTIRWAKLSDAAEDISDKERKMIASELKKDLRILDKNAFAQENQLWPVAVEEFGYGI
ncbi:SUKH-4 family immunity protein [Flavobacterium foetidum]|uniref:SUKH-4 family immunity protein n=1 Tax=Flavobacterium foetidum TaxID=2026681 RepID=UPI001074EC30|nr:SUKH-4 family immunity protein [Flavobacterium foetidum]KAF2509095.1 hypothetical protein E0W73_18985 [Flavobacterium foetidum]